jgi:ubiquinone/menaquinone biosynthesis C-methylase UbiE
MSESWEQNTTHFSLPAAAYVRGALPADLIPAGEVDLFSLLLAELAPEGLTRLVEIGKEHELRLHRFKRTMGLARVQRVLGILKGLQPANLLDIGSGRGAFLWPLIDAFPWLPVTAVDRLDYRVADIRAVCDGGITTLAAAQADATALPFADRSYDVVTMLEVLEHIPDTQRALAEVCRVAERFLVLSVPSRPDDNPEHIHLFNRETIVRLLERQMSRVTVEYVLNHMIVVARR